MNRTQRKQYEKQIKAELTNARRQSLDPFGGVDSTTTSLLHEWNNRKCDDLERALQRVRDEHYGECENCHQPIGERLEAQPDAQYCTTCQRQYEARYPTKLHIIGGVA